MTPSKQCIELLKSIEVLRLTPYKPTEDDRPTIGYGNTYYEDGKPVAMHDKSITRERAEELFVNILQQFASAVNKHITSCNQHEYDAFVIFCYNCGAKAMEGNISKLFNAKKIEELKKFWTSSYITQNGKVLNGLVNRRKAEFNLFLTGQYKRW